jgi:hypothetical protein
MKKKANSDLGERVYDDERILCISFSRRQKLNNRKKEKSNWFLLGDVVGCGL